MPKINISITKARIESFRVSLEEKKPEVNVTIGLYTAGGKKITEYTAQTNHWEEDKKFELPLEVVKPIVKILKELEKVAIKHCRNEQKQLK